MRFSIRKINNSNRRANQRGQVAGLIGILALLVLAVGLFSFEVGRANLATQQLQNSTDAATLACAATLASEDNTNPTAAHNDAVQTALKLFEQNLVMSQTLASTTIVGTYPNTPPVGQATLCFEFIDPITHNIVGPNVATGKVVRVHSDFGILPAFGNFLGLGMFAVHAVSNSSVPQLDIVVCFDISGSMDDQTPITLVKRTWDTSFSSLRTPPTGFPNGQIIYNLFSTPYGQNGKLADVIQQGANGTSFNAVPPEQLSFAYQNPNSILYFSVPWCAAARSLGYNAPDLHSNGVYPDAGCPPGNYGVNGAFSWDGFPVFTDVVVNLDQNTTFAGTTSGGYSFPNVATLVEAARGNLDSTTNFNNSLAYSSVPTSVNPQSGYQAQYFRAANALLQPINDAKAACNTFLDIVNSDTDAHFGFVAFDGAVGSAANSTDTRYNLDPDQFIGMPPFGVQLPYPQPMVPLDPTPGNSNYTTVTTALNSCVAKGGTNIGLAVKTAVDQLTTNQRPGAVRAIVLFTDGQPDIGGPLDADPWKNARDAAVLASRAGIPVYTIGLAQDPQVVAGQTAILNDTNSDPIAGGIAAISGHGATYNSVSNSPQLTVVFEKIARCLVELVENDAAGGQDMQVGG
jgi:hypothetical protein